jgi:hypothetical protein
LRKRGNPLIVVLEIQVFEDGKMSTPCYAYDNRNSAEQKYHAILSSASVSKLPRHSAVMLTDDGYYIKSESYEHGGE